jgi:hypothetical protein
LFVAEANDGESVRFDDRGTLRVVLEMLVVYAAIQFNDEQVRDTAEVHHVCAERLLATKLQSV